MGGMLLRDNSGLTLVVNAMGGSRTFLVFGNVDTNGSDGARADSSRHP